MPRRRSRPCSRWTPSLKRPAKSTFGWASSTSSNKSTRRASRSVLFLCFFLFFFFLFLWVLTQLPRQCFQFIRTSPPAPLSEADVWFQIGHVHEQQKDLTLAKEAYESVIAQNPTHSKALLQLGWLLSQPSPFHDQNAALKYLTRSLECGNVTHNQPPEERETTISNTLFFCTRQIKKTHRRGTFWGGSTCSSKSTTRPTSTTSRPCTATAATQTTGAQSACCISKSTR